MRQTKPGPSLAKIWCTIMGECPAPPQRRAVSGSRRPSSRLSRSALGEDTVNHVAFAVAALAVTSPPMGVNSEAVRENDAVVLWILDAEVDGFEARA